MAASVVALTGLGIAAVVQHEGRDGRGATGAVAPTPSSAAGGDPSAGDTAALEARTSADPTDLAAWQQLSRRYVQTAVRTGDPAYYELARGALDRADALAPGNHDTTVTEGVLELSLHDFARAHELAAVAHQQVPEDPETLAVLVDASVELGRYDEAADQLAVLLERRPDSAALSRLSYLRELHGDLAGARTAMVQAEQAAGSPADRAAIATFLGDLALTGRDLDGAGAAYDRARRASPGLATTDIGRARLAAAQGKLDEAIATLGAVVDRAPTPPSATLLGELQQAAGRDGDAAASFALARAGIQLLATSGATVDLEAALFEADHGEASAAVDLAREAYATRATVLTADALGWALTKAGRTQEALPYVTEALVLGTRSPVLQGHAAVAFAAAGQDAVAATALQAAFASSAWSAPALRPDLAGLADRLGVDVPADWRP